MKFDDKYDWARNPMKRIKPKDGAAIGSAAVPDSAMPTMDLSGGPPARSAAIVAGRVPMSSSVPTQVSPSPAKPSATGLTPAQQAQAFRVSAYNGRMQYRNAMRSGASPEQLDAIKRNFMQNDLAAWGETAKAPNPSVQTTEQVLRSRANLDSQAKRIAEIRAKEAAAGVSQDPAYDAGQAVLPENLRGQKFSNVGDQAAYRDFSRFAGTAPTIDYAAGEVSDAATKLAIRQRMEAERAQAALAKANEGIEFAPYDPIEAGRRAERTQDVFAENKGAADEARKQILARQEKERALAALAKDTAGSEMTTRMAQNERIAREAREKPIVSGADRISEAQARQVEDAMSGSGINPVAGQMAVQNRTAAQQVTGVNPSQILDIAADPNGPFPKIRMRFGRTLLDPLNMNKTGTIQRGLIDGDLGEDIQNMRTLEEAVVVPLRRLAAADPQTAAMTATQVLAQLPAPGIGDSYSFKGGAFDSEAMRAYANALNNFRSQLRAIERAGR